MMISFLRSFVDTSVYPAILSKKLRFRIFYLISTYFLIAVLSSILFFFRTFPQIEADAQKAAMHIQESWPQDLSVRWNGQELSLYPQESLRVPYPAHFSFTETLPAYLAEIQTGPSPQNSKESLFFITKDELTIQTGTQEPSSSPLTEIFGTESWLYTKSDIEALDSIAVAYLHEVRPILTIGHFFIVFIGVLLGRLILLPLYAFIAQIFFWITRSRGSYGLSWKLGLILLPTAEIIRLFAQALSENNNGYFWTIWLILFGVVVATNRNRLNAN